MEQTVSAARDNPPTTTQYRISIGPTGGRVIAGINKCNSKSVAFWLGFWQELVTDDSKWWIDIEEIGYFDHSEAEEYVISGSPLSPYYMQVWRSFSVKWLATDYYDNLDLAVITARVMIERPSFPNDRATRIILGCL